MNWSFLGQKAKNLQILKNAGFLVPNFIVLCKEEYDRIIQSEIYGQEFITKVSSQLSGNIFAVRSSASSEDTQISSWAGQFHTEIHIEKKNLIQAIELTRNESLKNMKTWEALSIIIQEYIEADISGICFTRNPLWWRESLLEYHFWIGQDIVSGNIIPEKRMYMKWEILKDLPWWLDISVFYAIEKLFGYPQDIEWCIQDKRCYILQSRPITTLEKWAYETIQQLESLIKDKKSPYYFYKNTITEVAPRPKPFTFSLLEKIYANTWPILQVYKKYGITYSDTKFFTILGNDLYIDKEKELQSLFPILQLHTNGKYRFKRIWWLFVSIKNFFALIKISFTLWANEFLFEEILHAFNHHSPKDDTIENVIEKFLEDYRITFEINLRSSFLTQKLWNLLGKEKDCLSEILQLWNFLSKRESYKIPLPSNLEGNSIEISDIGIFSSCLHKNPPSKKTELWWENQTPSKKKMLEKIIIQASLLQELREYGRILMIKNLSHIRKILREKNIHLETISFSLIDECIGNQINEEKLKKRKAQYNTYLTSNFPHEISSHYNTRGNKSEGYTPISVGTAEWILVDKNTLLDTKGKKILFTENLSPDLLQYFWIIEGIISRHGWVLSHLSILAREKNIPIVILENWFWSPPFGKIISIDGATGSITENTRI